MASCEFFAKCSFLYDQLADKPATAKLYKNSYCCGEIHKCARYRVFKMLGRAFVPEDLYPNEMDRADAIIADAKGQASG